MFQLKRENLCLELDIILDFGMEHKFETKHIFIAENRNQYIYFACLCMSVCIR